MTVDEYRVPTKTWLRGATFLRLEQAARNRHTTIADLLSQLADSAVRPKPPRQPYVRITPERRQMIAALHEAGHSPKEISVAVGCSIASVRNHLPKGTR